MAFIGFEWILLVVKMITHGNAREKVKSLENSGVGLVLSILFKEFPWGLEGLVRFGVSSLVFAVFHGKSFEIAVQDSLIF